jgi:membrane protein
LTIGLLIALWSASAGVDSLRIALNSVYNLEEKRSWIKTKLISLFLTFSLTVLITIACGIVFYGWKFISLILTTINLPISSPFVLIIFQWIIVLTVLLIIYGLLYNFLPMHEPHKWVWITPGSVTGIILWLTLSYAFRTYLSFFNTYDKTYGSLGAVIILMLWLYLTALVILIGGIINATLQEMTDPETAAESEKQSEIKLEKAKADRAPEEIEKVKEEGRQTRKELSEGNKPEKSSSAPILAAPEKNIQKEKTIAENTNPGESEKFVLETKFSENAKQPDSKTIVGLTVAGAFGFLMGLIFRKKSD